MYSLFCSVLRFNYKCLSSLPDCHRSSKKSSSSSSVYGSHPQESKPTTSQKGRLSSIIRLKPSPTLDVYKDRHNEITISWVWLKTLKLRWESNFIMPEVSSSWTIKDLKHMC